MASASAIPPSHVGTHSFQPDAGGPDHHQFPELKSAAVDDEWEMVPPSSQVKFDVPENATVKKSNSKCMLHSQSSPNLQEYILEESDSEDEGDKDEFTITAQDDVSSTFTMVSGPPSVNSIWSSTISFKDALLKNDESFSKKAVEEKPKHRHHQHIKKVKPKFVVAPVCPIQHAKSTGDLNSLLTVDEDEVLGDTDAHEYYALKAQGSLGRRNGRKVRPDEAKRLKITMNKKNSQRAQQQGR
jgi:hypothetical protein